MPTIFVITCKDLMLWLITALILGSTFTVFLILISSISILVMEPKKQLMRKPEFNHKAYVMDDWLIESDNDLGIRTFNINCIQ